MKIRWTLNRAVILNVYQYGDETIELAGGRLLLRGVNGSGKSTAMNMLLPFLAGGRDVELPHHLAWSGRNFALPDRQDRARVYEIVLTEGLPDDIEALIDGGLLVDLWDDMYLRKDIRGACRPRSSRSPSSMPA